MNFERGQPHNSPHMHVRSAEHRASICINGNVLAGKLPSKKLKEIQKWIVVNKTELEQAWEVSLSEQLPDRIPPLK